MRTVDRVLARYFTATSVEGILPKLQKSVAGWKLGDLLPVFKHLGWDVRPGKGLKNTDDLNAFKYKPQEFGSADVGKAKAMWQAAKDGEFSSLPDPDHLAVGTLVWLDVKPLKVSGNATFKAIQLEVVEAVAFTSPTGKTFRAFGPMATVMGLSAERVYDYGKGEKITLEKWLKVEGEFHAQATAESRGPGAAPSSAKIGECPCCFNFFRLTPRSKHGDSSLPGLVLHGYKRPGVGYIRGTCFGVGWPAFELSREGTLGFIKWMENEELVWAEVALDVARKREQSELEGPRGDMVRRDETSPEEWESLQDGVIAKAEASVASVKKAIDFAKNEASRWKPRQLGTMKPG